MTLLPTKLRADEDYLSIADIQAAADLPEAIIRVPQWGGGAIRVRALSLMQRDQVARESTDRDGTIDPVKQIEATLREGVLVPKFDPASAQLLRYKNGHALEQIAQFIWALSALDQEYIDSIVQQLSGAERAPPGDPPAPSPRAPASVLDRGAEHKVPAAARRARAAP